MPTRHPTPRQRHPQAQPPRRSAATPSTTSPTPPTRQTPPSSTRSASQSPRRPPPLSKRSYPTAASGTPSAIRQATSPVTQRRRKPRSQPPRNYRSLQPNSSREHVRKHRHPSRASPDAVRPPAHLRTGRSGRTHNPRQHDVANRPSTRSRATPLTQHRPPLSCSPRFERGPPPTPTHVPIERAGRHELTPSPRHGYRLE